jgi:hypothetical protein
METRTLKYQVIDNFLSPESLKKLQDAMLEITCTNPIPWFYSSSVDYIDPANDYLNNFQFTHTFYINARPCSDRFHLLEEMLFKLKPAALIRIKANLQTVTEKRITHKFHVDVENIKCKTAIFYVNSNDGVTIFEDGTEINSLANRLVCFDSDIKHVGTSCTDQKVRCVINLNYF